MANSALATVRVITANNSGKRTEAIIKITPHYMVAAISGEACARYFATTDRPASSNYCIGIDGDIAVSVDEDCRAWTTSSEWNDQRAVTVECANQPDGSLTDKTYKALVALFADVCKRHNIVPHYDGTIYGTITMHRQFAATDCPGTWLTKKIASGEMEKDILAAMGKTVTTTQTDKLYRVRESWDKPATQVGAYKSITTARSVAVNGLHVYDSTGADCGTSDQVTVWRLHSGSGGKGEFFYTANPQERANLLDGGWKDDGKAWTAPVKGGAVWRLYNQTTGRHIFTTDSNEKNYLKKNGWTLEGIAFCSGGTKKVYRMYDTKNGRHLLTAAKGEATALEACKWQTDSVSIYGV